MIDIPCILVIALAVIHALDQHAITIVPREDGALAADVLDVDVPVLDPLDLVAHSAGEHLVLSLAVAELGDGLDAVCALAPRARAVAFAVSHAGGSERPGASLEGGVVRFLGPGVGSWGG